MTREMVPCDPSFPVHGYAYMTACCKITLRGIVRWPWSGVQDKSVKPQLVEWKVRTI